MLPNSGVSVTCRVGLQEKGRVIACKTGNVGSGTIHGHGGRDKAFACFSENLSPVVCVAVIADF